MQRIACCVGSGCSLSGHDEHGTGCSTDVTQHVTRDALRHSLGAEGWISLYGIAEIIIPSTRRGEVEGASENRALRSSVGREDLGDDEYVQWGSVSNN